MKKASIFYMFVFLFLVCCVNIQISNSLNATKIFASAFFSSSDNLKIRAYGDSISAGYGLAGYDNYVNKTSAIVEDSYPNVFLKEYVNIFGGEIKSYAVTGYNSSQLAEDLKKYQNETATDLEDFLSTDIFTLCIGANNILKVASENLENYLKGTISDDEYRILLNQACVQFELDYSNNIIPVLTKNSNATVIAMTIYNPYKYVTFNDIVVNTQNANNDLILKSILSGLDKSFKKMLQTTMEYLQKINNVIKQSKSKNIIVVDVNQNFEKLTQEKYKNYINADLSKMTITKEVFDAIDFTNFDFSSLIKKLILCVDPHPTMAGHHYIANLHKQEFCAFKLSLKTNLNEIQSDQDNIEFLIDSIGGKGNFLFKLYKNINNNVTLLKETTQKNFSVQAHKLAGAGNLYVEIYEGTFMMGKSNEINYSYNLKDESFNSEPVTSNNTPLPSNQNANYVVLACIICIGIIAFVVVFFIVLKLYKKYNNNKT